MDVDILLSFGQAADGLPAEDTTARSVIERTCCAVLVRLGRGA